MEDKEVLVTAGPVRLCPVYGSADEAITAEKDR